MDERSHIADIILLGSGHIGGFLFLLRLRKIGSLAVRLAICRKLFRWWRLNAHRLAGNRASIGRGLHEFKIRWCLL